MFLAWCDNLGRDTLVWPSDLHGIVNTDQGMVVRYRCNCGAMAESLVGIGSPIHLDVSAA
jgi:hypothetical protein